MMNSKWAGARHAVALSLPATCLLVGGPAMSGPEASTDSSPLPTVVVTGAVDKDSAITQAPTMAPLDVTQPTSLLSQYYIENNIAPSANFDDIVKIVPSVYSVSPNGPGLSENQILSIRGFSDGFYNVTFDGIPWGDSNDFTHHSTSYFMGHDLGNISVDRGPGTAATIGNATFGGTIGINSKNPLADMTVTPYASYGSFNTQVIGAEFDTGQMEKYNGAAGFIDGESLSSDGYLNNLGINRKNLFTKFAVPVGDNTVVSFAGMYNELVQYISLGATAAQIAQFGPTFGLSRDPTNQNYFGYNNDHIHTDWEYIGVVSKFAESWTLDNKVYTYAYYHVGENGLDPNGETPNGTTYGPNDVPGQLLINDYRSWGDTLNLKDALSFGTFSTGIWFDRQLNLRQLTEVDFTLGGALNPAGNPATGGIDRELTQVLTTLQPFVQFDWKVLPGLIVSPGVRYDHFERAVDATVDVKSAYAESYSNTYTATLPSVVVHYDLAKDWAAYAQAAKGFLAPNENFFNYSKNNPTAISPASTNLSPQQSWNYQAGTSWQTQALSLSADVYYIDFANLIGSTTNGGNVLFFNQGGVIYKGVEAEATAFLGMGFSVYANGSINSAKDKGVDIQNPGQWVANAPKSTGSLGLIFNKSEWYASLIGKYVGSRFGDVGQAIPLGGYTTVDAALGYTVGDNGPAWARKANLKLALNNLADSHKIYALAGYTADLGTPLYWTIPGRSVFVTASMPF
ncbi:MAG TPA: TonB-dependent receptor [Steroidobacteraceae bacterium]|jgi:iron complex outermembrane receptor protein|nr:TonB-dependent receptor [Steroidobacteraceae bacterium]